MEICGFKWTKILLRLKYILERFEVFIPSRRVFCQTESFSFLDLKPKLKAIESPCMSDSPTKEEVREMIKEIVHEDVPAIVNDAVRSALKSDREDFEKMFKLDAGVWVWLGDSYRLSRESKSKVIGIIVTSITAAVISLMLAGYKIMSTDSTHQPSQQANSAKVKP